MKNTHARKVIIIILAVVILFGAAGAAIWRFMPQEEDNTADPFALLSEGFTDRKVVDEDSALAAIGDVAQVLGIENVNAEFSNCEVNTVFSNTYYRFQQEYKGIPVYGRSVIVAADKDGNSLSLSGNYLSNGNLDISPKLDEKSAIEIIQQHYGNNAVIKSRGLSVYSLNDSISELAWKIYIQTEKLREVCFVSAENGKLIETIDQFNEYSNKEILDSIGAKYSAAGNAQIYLSDSSRAIVAVKASQQDIDSNIAVEELPKIICDADDECDEYVMALKSLITAYDFFKDVLQLNSFDGEGGKINLIFCDKGVLNDNAKGNGHNEDGYLIIGTPDKIYSKPIGNALDIVGHEYTHMVVHQIVDFANLVETVGLNEGIADIYGNLMEVKSYGDSNQVWQLGEKAGHSKYSMDDYKDMNSFDYSDTDGHNNAAIISHAAYLMWKGIDGSDVFEPLSTEELAKLFYETLYTLPSDCTFSQFRALVQNTARYQDLSDKQRSCVSNAFFQVGITPAAMPVVKNNLSVEVYDIKGLIYDNYTLYVQHGNSEKKYSGEDINEQGLTFPESGEYGLRIVDNANTDNETIVSVTAVDHGGVEKMPIFTRCGLSKVDDLIGLLETDEEELSSIDYNDLVTDVYNYSDSYNDGYNDYKISYKIPKINIDSADVQKINSDIYNKLYHDIVEKELSNMSYGVSVINLEISYDWAINGDVLSLWTTCNDSWGGTHYIIYNVSISTGKVVNKNDLLSYVGFSEEQYITTAEQVLGSKFWSAWDRTNENFQNNNFISLFNEALEKTISQENIDQSFPYINDKGELCIIAKVYSLAGADYYWNNLNMVNFILVPDYATPVESNTHTINISEDEAYQIACDYWNYEPGDISTETGFELFVVPEYGGGLREISSTGKSYYSYMLRWLVVDPEDTSNTWMSTCDIIFIDAETGECVPPIYE